MMKILLNNSVSKTSVIMFLLLNTVLSAKLKLNSRKLDNCGNVSERELRNILGPAYNPRYMSIQEPQTVVTDENTGMKRKISDNAPSFYVDNSYVAEVDGDQPAWEMNFNLRQKRATSSSKHLRNTMAELDILNSDDMNSNQPNTPWHCNSRIKWIDLGRDYFPRYLRTVECTSHDCWYGHYTCKPRSFTMKILRRRAGYCASFNNHDDTLRKVGQQGLPSELRQLWIWEERAVNFCCDCSA